MDLVILDSWTPAWTPWMLWYNWTSLIWTERFQLPGEFELKSKDITGVMNYLSPGAAISLMDTYEMMMVETISIANDNDGIPEATVTGRSADFITDYRIVYEGGNSADVTKRFQMAQSYTPFRAAAVSLWNALVNTTGKHADRPNGVIPLDPTRSTQDAIPNVAISNAVSHSATARNRFLVPGQLTPAVQAFLQLDNLGLRTVRPHGASAKIVTVDTSNTSSRGTTTDTTVNPCNTLNFEIFDTVDRSVTHDPTTAIVFSDVRGDFNNQKYLISNKDYFTYYHVVASDPAAGYSDGYRTAGQAALTGFSRRVEWLNAGTPDASDTATVNAFRSDMPGVGDSFLTQHRKVRMFEGDLNDNSIYQYKTDYNLGDLVTVVGNYKITQDMRVTEYTRTQDDSGIRGYPGLTNITDD